ncbi:hypothetical protein [Cellulosilyticum ruminicola]|uniref:hypothetical protein n=1 Tax=Cellulosilyticum ruminicola TaxID=425254 RepID=UPI0006CFAE7C|nr:hypothetical protein [Cellulosilyticum ruminicola]
MYITQMEWHGWLFEIQDNDQLFGKTKVEASRDDIVEEFYIAADYLSERTCEELYENYLYVYGEG